LYLLSNTLVVASAQQLGQPNSYPSTSNNNMVSILNYSAFIDKMGNLHIVGEVQNNSTTHIRSVQIMGTFYSINNTVVRTESVYTQPEDLVPGYLSPFELILLSINAPVKEIDHYRLQLTWQEPTTKNAQAMTKVISQKSIVATIGSSKQPISCGQEIKGIVTLRQNLNCAGDGLIVGDNNNDNGTTKTTTLNLNGFSIHGTGADNSKVGISISENNATINGPGSISGFEEAILVTKSNQLKISSVTLQDNEIAILTTGANSVEIKENMMKNNTIGVDSHSSSSVNVESNLIINNGFVGIMFVNTTESNLAKNNINGSQYGIFFVSSTENTAILNSLSGNTIDLNNANGLAPSSNKNILTDNNCSTSIPSGLCIS
jgi:parallel beta-helix repeat protein